MAVFRIERTRDYTVMSNHHLRNRALSLKAKGLLSMMLSLPDDWNYTTRGLAKICKEGVDAIGGALRELEGAGYIVRHQLRDRQGRISDTEYVIYEQPQLPETPGPDTAGPDTDSPDTENPYLDKPDTEKPAELNIEKSNTQKSITHGSSTIRIAGVRNQHRLPLIHNGQGNVGQSLLGAQQGADFRLRIQGYAVSSLIPLCNRLQKSFLVADGIHIVFLIGRRPAQCLPNMRGRRNIGRSHAQIDNPLSCRLLSAFNLQQR